MKVIHLLITTRMQTSTLAVSSRLLVFNAISVIEIALFCVSFVCYYIAEYIDEVDCTYACKHCGALFWYNERINKKKGNSKNLTFSMCCLQGKIQLPTMRPPPPGLYHLYMDKKSVRSRNFIKNIRQYNNMFSFTSMGGKIDHSKNGGGGPYCFSLSGMAYHSIGSLVPPDGARPVYSQLYVYDTENEVQNRIDAVRSVNHNL